MKRLLHILAGILILFLILSVLPLSQRLPGNSQPLVEKKYSGWNGVLRAWVCSRWSCSGSFITWLNRCAAQFEKGHPGVYIEFTAVSEAALNEAGADGLRAPELLFFSPGTLASPSDLETAPSHPNPALQHEYALPVCMGGYIWVINTAICETIPDAAVHPADTPGQSFSMASAGLKDTITDLVLPDPGIDLGLPAAAGTSRTLDDFIDGNIPALIVSQRELSRLIQLRDAGKGPDWRCIPSGSYMYADQLLLGGVVSHQDADADARTSLARSFLQFLLEEECQRQLSSIGAFPVTSATAYPAASPYATMEGLLRSLELAVPPYFP